MAKRYTPTTSDPLNLDNDEAVVSRSGQAAAETAGLDGEVQAQTGGDSSSGTGAGNGGFKNGPFNPYAWGNVTVDVSGTDIRVRVENISGPASAIRYRIFGTVTEGT